jgi:hypothetical protein
MIMMYDKQLKCYKFTYINLQEIRAHVKAFEHKGLNLETYNVYEYDMSFKIDLNEF